MLRFFCFCTFLLCPVIAFSQKIVEGKVLDAYTKQGLEGVKVEVLDTEKTFLTDEKGFFSVEVFEDVCILIFSKENYTEKRFEVEATQLKTILPTLLLEPDNEQDTENSILISDSELDDENGSEAMVPILQSSQDIFQRRVAFDFNAVFFKQRGYDAKENTVLLNGIKMNRIENGNVQWANWGGLNDVTRNQEFSTNINASDYTFGGLAGSTYINIRPSLNRRGLRLTASAANRSYSGRLMATYHSGKNAQGVSYSLSASRRWAANKTYFDGTLYNAYAVFGAVEYELANYHSISALAMWSYLRRGKTAPLTAEVLNLMGNSYNPYWGEQNGEVRNSRNRIISEPILSLSYRYEKENTRFNFDLGYQFGKNGNTRLSYANAQNPDPIYYQKLPSYYINQLQADWQMASLQKDYFLQNSQLDWEKIYRTNGNITDKRSAFAISNDVSDERTFSVNANFQTLLFPNLKWIVGGMFRNVFSENYAQIDDLLGGDFFMNYDYFSDVAYDENDTDLKKKVGDKWNYFYNLKANQADLFSQFEFSAKKLKCFVSGSYNYTDYQREGKYDYLMFRNSFGMSDKLTFGGFSTKSGLSYAFTPRHIFQANAAYLTSPQPLRTAFVNIRNSNESIPNQKNETSYSFDTSYIFRTPYFKSKLSAYYAQIFDTSQLSFFYTEMAVSDQIRNDFVSQVLQNVQKTHFGLEFGAEAQLLPSVKLTAVTALGQYTYANNPKMLISSAENEMAVIDEVFFKNYFVPSTPQRAYSLGAEWRGANNWRASVTANLLTHRYIALSAINRTSQFFKDPDTKAYFPSLTSQKVRSLLKQERLPDVFLMNLMVGKSWAYQKKYISILLSINNLLDNSLLSGGFEQSRIGDYQRLLSDNANGTPSFGNRYFVGYGRTYMINFSVSL